MAVDPEYSPLACILQFHSTLVMNVITHDRAYALFPRQTFLDRTGITLGNNGNLNSLKKAYEKYIARNFRIPVAALPDQIDLMSFGHRRIGDSKTWSIELDTTGVTIPDWLFVATAKFGRPLMMANGFTLRTSQPTIPRKPDQNPSRDRYSDGNSLLCFEAFYSPILHFPLILPLHSRPFRVFSLQNHKWTGYTGTYSFIAAQERFEIEKYGLPELNRATIRPELIPGWQYWDLEVLRLVQKDFEKWPTNA
ncbi:hypothetical protein FRC17_006742 [Serendipita sp. 399]|nr:hypothetical protein FRC17_006742 [Serendipita sp. 399]